MKQWKIPEEIKAMLAVEKITEKKILYRAKTDMNLEGSYQDGVVILTEQILYFFQETKEAEHVHYFKGYGSLREMAGDWEKEWTVRRYEVINIESMLIEPQVACSTLTIRYRGIDYCIAAFSNFCKQPVHRLIMTWEGRPFEEDEEIYCPNCGRMYPDSASKVCPRCTNRKTVFIRAAKYFMPYRFKLVLMLICILVGAGLNLVWPYLSGMILYDRILAKDQDFLNRLGIAHGDFVTALFLAVITMVVVKLTLLLLRIVQGVFTAQMVTGVVRNMEKDIFRVMGKLSISFYKNRQTGGLMTRVMSDADRVTGFYFDCAPYILINGLIILASVTVMARINWQMTIVTILLFPALVAISLYLRPRIWVLFGKRHRAERSVNSTVNDNLTGARVIKSFGQERLEAERFLEPNKRLLEAEISISRQQNAFQILYGGAQEIASFAVWGLGVYFLMSGKNMNLGTLITFTGYVGQLSGPMGFFARVYNQWADSMNSAKRMFEIMDAIPEVKEAPDALRMEKPEGEISLQHVTFGYTENNTVLKDITLKIPAGSMLGIVGRSGAGKTTIVNLISRLYDPVEGEITIDGIDIKKICFHDLRKNVAMVSQETYIFMGTVADNIAYGKPEAGRMEIFRAAKLAGAHEFIMRMSDAYDTRIGASGRELSGGERQRISIARAILANPKILILDEATASVDTETERLIQKSINYLVKGRTTISIAHRLSTLRDADYLVVIEQGKITEQGTRDELFRLHGTYYKLLELQTKALAMEHLPSLEG